MKQFLLALTVLLCTPCAAMADDTAPMVLRQSKDIYALPGIGTVQTKGCTIVPSQMSAKLDHAGKAWLWFLDSNGEVEDGCEIVKVVTFQPVQVVKVSKPRPVRVAKR